VEAPIEASNITQLAFWPWWTVSDYWRPDDDDSDGTNAYVGMQDRPTEDEAIRNLRLQSRVIERNGKYLNIEWQHRIVLRLEQTVLNLVPMPDNPMAWIAARCTFSERQCAALLDEASSIIAVREMLGMPIDLAHEPIVVRLAA
jgi:hypothetical protein